MVVNFAYLFKLCFTRCATWVRMSNSYIIDTSCVFPFIYNFSTVTIYMYIELCLLCFVGIQLTRIDGAFLLSDRLRRDDV